MPFIFTITVIIKNSLKRLRTFFSNSTQPKVDFPTYTLLTRPLDDAYELEKNLSIPVIKAPLLEIEVVPLSQSEKATDYTALIVTSARALMIFPDIQSFLKKPIWCVGYKTALTAKNLGFETIYKADNSAEDLFKQIIAQITVEKESFLHICGEKLHFDIVKFLQEAGYRAKKCILYRTLPALELPTEVISAFKEGQIKLIPVYSKQTAEILSTLIGHHKLEDYLETIVLISCSASIVVPLQKNKWQKIIIKKDLSPSTLEKVFNKFNAEQETQMSRKYIWSLIAGIIALNICIAIGSFYLLNHLRTQESPPLRMEEVQDYMNEAVKQQKTDLLTEIKDRVKTEVADIKTEISSIKETLEVLKQQPAATPSSEVSERLSAETLILQAIMSVDTLLRDLGQDKETPRWLWQQLSIIAEKTDLALPEKLKDLTTLPVSRESLVRDIQNLELSLHTENTSPAPQKEETKISHPWLQKLENFLGQIIINKHAAENETPSASSPSLKEKSLMAIQTQNLEMIKALSQDPETPLALKEILYKASSREEILEGLMELKLRLLQKAVGGKE